MRVIDYGSGTGSFSEAFVILGHTVLRIDINEKFKDVRFTKISDVLDDELIETIKRFNPDVALGSPPCTTFSRGSIGTYWGGGNKAYIPKNQKSRDGITLAKRFKQLCQMSKIYFIENPVGLLSKMNFMQDIPMYEIWYCKYFDKVAKPTNIWSNSKLWKPRPICRNINKKQRLGLELLHCHHESAQRGAKTGTQGKKNATDRGMIPYQLSLEIALACEEELTQSRLM